MAGRAERRRRFRSRLLPALALALVLAAAAAHGQGAPQAAPGGFDTARADAVYAAALAFMVPRILDPTPVPLLAVWGLHGLTALDPRLRTEADDEEVRLLDETHVLATVKRPAPDDIEGWGHLAAGLAAAAWPASPAMRRAGTDGVMRNFFDEIFNHLDPYSRYEPPDIAAEDRQQRSGDAGTGLTLAARGGAIVVQDCVSDGPAGIAGLRPGDRILSVDGQSTRFQDPRTVTRWLAGAEDTTVTIVWRGRDGHPRSADLVRALVPPETVFFQRLGALAVIRISSFNRGTEAHLAAALHQAADAPRPPAGLVIDLRGNRGGLLRQAVGAADLLLPAGVITVTAGRNPEASHVWRADGDEVAGDLPLVVLVDGRTASAAEIFAAALADRGRAVVVGSATLGKGLVQTVAPMPDGGELFVTWSRVLAPRGWPLQGLGVLPQVCTSVGADDIAQEMKQLEDGSAPLALPLARTRAARAPIPAAQIVALRNACPAAEGRDQDLQVARWLIEHPAAYATALLPPMRAPAAAPIAPSAAPSVAPSAAAPPPAPTSVPPAAALQPQPQERAPGPAIAPADGQAIGPSADKP